MAVAEERPADRHALRAGGHAGCRVAELPQRLRAGGGGVRDVERIVAAAAVIQARHQDRAPVVDAGARGAQADVADRRRAVDEVLVGIGLVGKRVDAR
jgi:hypothetical protein